MDPRSVADRIASDRLAAFATLAFAAQLVLAGGSTSVARAAGAESPQRHGGELVRAVERLANTGRVLYVAAHPDDENTRLLAWLVGERGVDAAYVSMTRGGGGQNLVGTEQSELLGVLRTLELLEARKVDGASQFFTRARDFGYSKSPEETLRFWGRERALGDLVRVIRRFRPDVIVTRFSADGGGHGHHTASAQLAAEAFEAAADPERFPGAGEPWQVERLVRNVSTWRLPDDADLSRHVAANVGGYEPLIGRSWGEVAAESRTQHASQGFGTAPQRGPIDEHFEPLAGSVPESDLLEGIDLSWKRVPDSTRLRRALERAADEMNPRAPHRVLPLLAEAHAAMRSLPASPRREARLAELEGIVRDVAGLWLSARAETPAVTRGQPVEASIEALNRSDADVTLHSVRLPGGELVRFDERLSAAAPLERTIAFRVPDDAELAVPHWLRGDVEYAFYGSEEPELIGMPDTPSSLPVVFDVTVGGVRMDVPGELRHAVTDRVRGEIVRRVEVLPPVTASAASEVLLHPNGEAASLRVVLRASAGPASGRLVAELPDGWRSEPAAVPFDLAEAGAEREITVRIVPPQGATGVAEPGTARLVVTAADGSRTDWRLDTIDHPHVPVRAVLRPSTVRLVPLDLSGTDRTIAYVPGSGDVVAESLRLVGYDVVEIDPESLGAEDLSRFDAVVIGIRAYNVHPRLQHARERLDEYARGGGLVLTQYNTSSSWRPLDADVGPYPLAIGRGRVTDETAELVPIDPDDTLLARPNRLVAADFVGWVQERGLYFAEDWDPRYRPVFRSNDVGEEPLEGSVLVAPVGEGAYVYTGLSFFRQLPAGVPGAYRLLANLLAWTPEPGGS